MNIAVAEKNAMTIYLKSINSTQDVTICMVRENGRDMLLIIGDPAGFDAKRLDANDEMYLAPLNHASAKKLRELFPFTAPKKVLTSNRTFGVGDRLGLATPGHLRVFKKYDALPVLAQQSIRELNLTGRGYQQVLDCATFAVFREGFRRGFGADGDHIKTIEEIDYAVSCGYTMLTLDCSKYIRNDVSSMTKEQIMAESKPSSELEETYIGKDVEIGDGIVISFTHEELFRAELIYRGAINYVKLIYDMYIKDHSQMDFEVSIDETDTPTTPLQHYFVANELKKLGVTFATMAPRFCGEFQKGIDYLGDLEQFEREFIVHSAIAEHFGYKLSIHSGSDKFAVYPTIGKYSNGRFHVKTSGTSWLEAMRLVAQKDPALYREIHKFALGVFSEAKKFYHVTTDLNKIPDVDLLRDEELPELLDKNDSRQLIHITYGSILGEKNPDGSYRFKDRLYRVLEEHADGYAELLEKHIGKHLELLYKEL